MSENIFSELYFLFYAILSGAFLAAVYDIFRIMRRVFVHSDFIVSLEDLVFWIFCAVSVFYLLNAQSDGRLRWFSVAGAAIGMFAYVTTISRIAVPFLSGVISCLFLPFRFLTERIKKWCGLLIRKIYRLLKKKLTLFRKLFRMILCKQ